MPIYLWTARKVMIDIDKRGKDKNRDHFKTSFVTDQSHTAAVFV
jgi:hypothetical protein